MSNERICAEIDLSAITYNLESMYQNLSPGTGMIAVIKTDGYGHGAVETALAAIRGGADMLAVAAVSEGAEIRRAGIDKPVLVLGAASSADVSFRCFIVFPLIMIF